MEVIKGGIESSDVVKLTLEIIVKKDLYSQELLSTLFSDITRYKGECKTVSIEKIKDYKPEVIKLPDNFK